MLRMFRQLDEKRQNDESGFTLIELLVVIIIIGILAAIAIPVFLSQRERAWRSAVQSDLRNAAVAQETHYTDEGGYTEDVDGDDADTTYLSDLGYNPTTDVTVVAETRGGTNDDQEYCLAGVHANNTDEVWYMGTGGTLSEAEDDGSSDGCPTFGTDLPDPTPDPPTGT